MAESYRIRPVDGADEEIADVLAELHKETFLDPSPIPDFDLGAWWVVYHEKRPVAFAGITQSTYGANIGYLKRAGVLPAHRGRGLQRRLIRVRERYAQAQGWRLVVTDTAIFNAPSANSLIKAGFELFRPMVPWSGEATLYWRKRYA